MNIPEVIKIINNTKTCMSSFIKDGLIPPELCKLISDLDDKLTEAIGYLELKKWVKVTEELTKELCEKVDLYIIGHNPEWVSEFNPNGFRECFPYDGGDWVSSVWSTCHDDYVACYDSKPILIRILPNPVGYIE